MKNLLNKRLSILRSYIAKRKLDAALITTYENRRYFSGFTGSNGYLIITQDDAILITDRRYTTQAKEQTTGCEIIEAQNERLEIINDYFAKKKIARLIMESAMSMGEYLPIKEKLNLKEILWEDEYFLELRMIKDKIEQSHIRQAIAAAEAGFERLIPRLRVGMTEKDLADELHYLVSKEGAEAMSFGTIVASGPRGALAHGYPTNRIIQNGDMVVVDFGVMKEGYCSDMTRTLLFGNVSPENMQIFDLVKTALDRAIEAIRPGVVAREVEQAHREVFQQAGFEKYALKGLGHGIGLQIHECPRIVIGNETVLKPNMVFTVEPGLYIPNVCGVRIEDDVLVTEDGVENLSHTPHEIHISS